MPSKSGEMTAQDVAREKHNTQDAPEIKLARK